MTCREKLALEHPDSVSDVCVGGCEGCPDEYGYMAPPVDCHLDEKTCRGCWNREIPSDEAHKVNMVDHPTHYNQGNMETIDEMILIFGVEAVMHFCMCNAWKYRARAAYKGNPSEDMEKSYWYLAKYKELEDWYYGVGKNSVKLP